MSKPAKPKKRAGRPGNLAMQFGARLLMHNSGFTEHHCRYLLREEGLSNLSAREWYAVARAIELGMENVEDFDELLRSIEYIK